MTPASPTPPDASRRSRGSIRKTACYCTAAIRWISWLASAIFLEVAYIMLNGDAPDEASYQTFRETITRHTLVHEQIARMCSGFRRDSHPMALMCALVGALAAFYHDVLDVENPQHRALAATRLLSKCPLSPP